MEGEQKANMQGLWRTGQLRVQTANSKDGNWCLSPNCVLPRGVITEIFGPDSSGRTSLAFSALAAATSGGEVCAYVDTNNTFDPASADAAGVDLRRMVWVRCGGNPEHALKCADLLVQAGGFGMIAFDLAGVRPETARRIPISSWFRLQRAIEPTRTVLALLEQQANARTAASLILEMKAGKVVWSGTPRVSQLLREATHQAITRKPVRSEVAHVRLSSCAGPSRCA
jgi:hypothetical protein